MSLRALRRLQATGGQASSFSVPGSEELKEKKAEEENDDDNEDDVQLDEDGDESEGETAEPAIIPARNVFDLLDDEEEDEEGEEDDEDCVKKTHEEGEESESKKENKAVNTVQLSEESPSAVNTCNEMSSGSSATNKKKKKKKRKGKAKATQGDDAIAKEEQIEDEIQRAFRELGLEETISAANTPGEGNEDREQSSYTEDDHGDVLAADTSILKPEAELRRIFGQRALRNEIDRGGDSDAGDSARRRGKGRRVRIPLPSCTLITPKDFWPPLKGLGITMEVDKVLPSGARLFRFRWSAQYKAVQDGFEDIVDGGDPNRIMQLLHHHPYHIGSLLAMADLFFHMGEAERAADHLERALFALEQSFHPTFSLGRTDCRINGALDDNAVEENHIFFETLMRQIMHLHRRGMNKAAYELCKAVFNADRRDPYGVLHRLDMAAIRAGHYNDVIRLVQQIEILQSAKTADGAAIEPISVCSHSLGILPGYAYSVPLSRLLDVMDGSSPDKDSSTQEAIAALSQAMLLHPQLLTYLAERLSSLTGGPRWKKVLSHRLFSKPKSQAIMDKSATLNKLTRLAVQTQHETWRDDRALKWLLSAAERAVSRCDDQSESSNEIGEDDWRCVRESSYPDSQQDEYFHLRVEEFSDEQSVTLPANEIQGANAAGGRPDAANLVSMESLTGENPLSLFVRSLMPWVALDHGRTMESVVQERQGRRVTGDNDDGVGGDDRPAEQERNEEN